MTEFDPKHPHGHMLRDGRKAELRGQLNDGRQVVIITDDDGFQHVSVRWPDGCERNDRQKHPLDVINAPAPKRRGRILVVLSANGGIYRFQDDDRIPDSWRIIARVDWTEGQGMEDGDGC